MTHAYSKEAQVLVVGAGPAGLFAAITLARYGVSVLLVEKRETTSVLSRALVISTRGMEILRSWGLEDAVRAGAAGVEPCAWVTHTLASGQGTVMPLGYPTAAEAASLSPTRPAWAPQDHLEPLLLAFLRSFAGAEIRFGSELMALEQSDSGVRTLLRDRRSGQTQEVETRFLVGADGAHSIARKQLGIPMDGPDALAEYHSIQFHASLAPIAGCHRYGLYVITHPDATGVLASRGPNDRWSYAREWMPGQRRLVDASEAQLSELITTAVGVPAIRLQIERVSAFSFAAQIAGRYRERRAFLVGDAAHRMTPRGGTGMNTAIQDAYDLGWKLAWVLRGWAAERLLDSYETDRRPVGLHNVMRSGDPAGARQQAAEALLWDLHGRVAHHWLRRGRRTVSTLDLLSHGLTVLADATEPYWTHVADILTTCAPLTTWTLEEPIAPAIGIPCGGAVLLRPDGREILRWPNYTGAALTGSVPGYLRQQAVV